MPDGGIYMIGTLDDGWPKKIGRSNNFIRRLGELCDWRGQELFLLESWTMPPDQAFLVEKMAHLMLHEEWVCDEWFHAPLAELARVVDAAISQFEDGEFVTEVAELVGDYEERRERTLAGLAAARARGRPGGARQRKTDREILDAEKLGMTAGAAKLGYSLSGYIKALARVKEKKK